MSNGIKKNIKVGFLNDFSGHWMGGVNYFKNLFLAMQMLDNPKLVPYIKKPGDNCADFLLKYVKLLPSSANKNWHYHLRKVLTILCGRKFNKQDYFMKKAGVDIISHFWGEVPEHTPTIAWIPDFQHLHLPHMFDDKEIANRNQTFMNMAAKSAAVILSSNDALNDFKAFAPQYVAKGKVLPFVAKWDGDIYRRLDKMHKAVSQKFSLPERYFYISNQFWKHKNHQIVFSAVKQLKEQGTEVVVVCSGNTGDCRHPAYFQELKDYIAQNNLQENIKILGMIESDEVLYLLRNCVSIINPSLFEGWSSTVEEAKSLGKNIILSDIKVHLEQNPPAACYFSPSNAQELAQIMRQNWENSSGGPDLELEQQARADLPRRFLAFARAYQQIVIEACEQKPDVSVITVTRNLIKNNREKVFIQCMRSVRRQYGCRVEHLVIDGASDDGTLELIKKYAGKGWIKYISEPDGGIYDAMNKGANLATGKYLAFLNSDDYYHHRKGLSRSVAELEKHSAHYSYAPVRMLKENGRLDKSHPHRRPRPQDVFVEMPYGHQSMLIRKDIFLKEGSYNLAYRSAADYDLIIRLVLNRYKGIEIPLNFVSFRMGGFSQQNWENSVTEVARIFTELYRPFYPLREEDARQIYISKQMPEELSSKLKEFLC